MNEGFICPSGASGAGGVLSQLAIGGVKRYGVVDEMEKKFILRKEIPQNWTTLMKQIA